MFIPADNTGSFRLQSFNIFEVSEDAEAASYRAATLG